MIKAIILDFDGVILESVDIKTGAFRELFSRYTADVEPVVAYHLKNNGVSRFVKFRYIWENMLNRSYDDSVRDRLGKEFSEIVTSKVIECPFVAGALDFLNMFHRKVPLYVASAVPEEELAAIVKGKEIAAYFDKVYGFPPTPKSRAVEDVMARETASSKEILFIGDSRQDLKVALESGVFFIARKNKEDFKDSGIPVFYDMKEITDYIADNLEVGNERI
jgi:phosphoglycolate phosphatase-like HAD superfamily hydrolase